jgi:hypothetical protein
MAEDVQPLALALRERRSACTSRARLQTIP